MPGKSGYEACQSIRSMSPDVPIIFISAKSEEMDRLVGFNSGADDFIIKPFSVREVVARVRAVARRCCKAQLDKKLEFEMGDLIVLPDELRAKRGDEVFDLSLRDIAILRLLAENPAKRWTGIRFFAMRGAKTISSTAERWTSTFLSFENESRLILNSRS